MNPRAGETFQEARKAKALTLEEISEQLHIRVDYLKALEAGEIDRIPSLTQAKGFIRSYAKFLELDPKTLLKETIPQLVPSPEKALESPPSGPKVEPETSHLIIFGEIGDVIRHRREIIGISKEDIEAHTHIPAHYVDYIENGEFDSFPSPAQARGMLNNYLQFLEIKPDELMNRYAEALQIRLSKRQEQASDTSQTTQRQPVQRSAPRVPRWVRMFLSPDLILITTVGVIIVILTIWGIGRVTRTQSEQIPQPTAPSLVEALLPTSTLVPTSTATPQVLTGGELLVVENPEGDLATEIPTVQVAPGASLEVFIIVRQRTYLRITTDGNTAFDGRTTPGTNLTFSAREEIRILTGNAAALQVFFNNQDQGILGIFGEIAELIFTQDGVIRPTKVPTSTPSTTETPTVTPAPDPTEEVVLPPEVNTPVP